jgi:hypothetical protein
MSNTRNLTGYLLLGLLTVVGVGGAALGVALAPKNVALTQAVDNTLGAANYSEVLTENTPQGKQSDYLTYQAPDRLGGYIESGNKRTYVFVIGDTEYQSLTVPANGSTKHLVFYKQSSQGAKALDPAHGYLPYAKQKGENVQKSGGTTTFTISKSGQVGTFTFTVSGQYVTSFNLAVKTANVSLVISQVGTAPPVKLPPGSKVVVAPTGSTGTSGTAG